MTFEKRLAERANEIDAALAALIDRETAQGVPARLTEAMRHAAMGGGKRLRPFLVTECAAVLGADAATARPAALAVELVHCYSLVHDDLPAMDNDAMRRGKPSVWKAFDDWTAILAGDALLTLAFDVLARENGALTPSQRLELTAEMARASGGRGMVGGQCLDLEADKLGKPTALTAAHVMHLQALKTGALFRFSCLAGSIAAGSGPVERGAMTRFGEKLGAAFQLADDLLDVVGDAAVVGKATGKDAAAGKATLVDLLGMDEARTRLSELESAALAEIAPLGHRADILRDALRFTCARTW